MKKFLSVLFLAAGHRLEGRPMISDATQLRLAEMVLENRATLNSLTKIVGNLVECAAQDGADPRLNYLVSTLDQMAAVRLYDGLEISKLRKELQNAES